jgi:large subunit ribosomal protein L1
MLRRVRVQQFLSFFKPYNSFATAKKKKKVNPENAPPTYNVLQALRLIRAYALAAFDETIEINILLNVDPKHGEQIVRGTCMMPHGLGKSEKVAVLTTEEMKEKARQAGADIIIDKQVLEDVKNGVINFEKCLATPEVIAELKPFARVLGPKGLMPNQKVGTLVPTDKLEQAIRETKMGSVTYRVDQGSTIHAPLGKVSFEEEKIKGNLKALMQSIIERRPPTLKGTYLLGANMSSTMGPGWNVSLESIDPRTKTCLL